MNAGRHARAYLARLRFAGLMILSALALSLTLSASAEASFSCPTKTTSAGGSYINVTYSVFAAICTDTGGGARYTVQYDDLNTAVTVSGTSISSASASDSCSIASGGSSGSYSLNLSYTADGSCTVSLTLTNRDAVSLLIVNDYSNAIATSVGATVTPFTLTPTTLTLTSSVNPSVFGQIVTFTANVTGSGGTPTGTVTFKDNGATIGTGTLSNGVATFITSSLSVASHPITASYGGDSTFDVSSGSLSSQQVVNRANTSTTITTSNSNPVVGESVTLTAFVLAASPGSGTPTGTLTFFDGGTPLATVSVVNNVATFTTSSLSSGPHLIAASYGGDSNFNTSTGSGVNVTVGQASASVSIASSVNPSVIGQSVTFTSTVSPVAPGSGQPTGTVEFRDDGTPIGTATLSGGTATLTTSSLSGRIHNVQAFYQGDTNFGAANSVLWAQTVNNASTTTTVSAAPNPASFGQSVTITITVAPTAPGAGTLNGNVTLSDSGSTIATATLANGSATIQTSSLGVGAHSLTASYAGETGYAASSGSTSVTINQASQTISFANPGAQSFTASPLTLAATASSGLMVAFSSATTGVCTVAGATVTFVTAGTCTINADQAGNGNYTAAPQVSQSFAVNAAVPGAPIIGAATAGDTQASVTFTAPASTGGAAITGYTATSNPGGLTASGASSPLTVSGLTNGVAYTFTVTATNSVGTGAASAASNSVRPAASQTITFANPGVQNFGTSPTLTASATSGLTVTFTSSTTSVCTVTTGGQLTFVTAGTCTINADQAGDASHAAAPQVSQSFAVNAVAPGAPTIGTATAGDTQALVSFTAPASTGGAAITGYTATSSPGGLTGTGTSSPITVAGLTNGVAYTFTVTATNSAGTGAASGASNSVRPVASQTITFTNPGAQNFGTSPTLTASATSGLTVTFTSSTTSVCTVTTGGRLTFVTAGTCTINADQAGDASHAAAPQVSQSFTVNAVAPGAPTIGTATAGDAQASVSFTAPASTGGAAITGYTVTSSPGSITASGATSPITVPGLTNGTSYTFTVTATNSAGTGAASAATNSATPKASQTIAFTNPGAQLLGTSPQLTATATSNLAVAFSSSTTSVCTVTTGGLLTFLQAGTCSINADQSGSAAFSPAPTVTQSFSVAAANQTVSFTSTAPAGATVGGATYTATATASSGLAVAITVDATAAAVCSISGGTVSFTGAGSCVLNADQAGNSNTNPAPRVQQSFVVNAVAPGAPTIGTATAGNGQATVTFTAPVFTGGAAITGYTVTSSPGNVTATGASSPIVVPGLTNGVAYTFTVRATNSVGTGSPSAASNSATPSGSQTIVFANPGAQTFGAPPTLTATASSGLAVTFTSGTTAVCTVTSGGALTFLTAGTCTINADQAGNVAFAPAPTVTQSFTVRPASQTVAFTSTAPAAAAVGGATYTPIATATSGLAVTISVDAASASVCAISGGVVSYLSSGTCVLNADQAGNASYTPASRVQQSFAVQVGVSSVTVAGPASSTFGASVTFTATVSPTRATGAVTFKEGAVTLGTASVVNGVALFTTSSFGAGAHSVIAVYGGDNAYAASTSTAAVVTVQQAATTTALAASTQSPVFGANVTFTATVAPNAASGVVEFRDGGVALGRVTLANGSASLSTTSLTAGAHQVVAVYLGDANHATSTSATIAVTVQRVVTTTALAVSTTTPAMGAPVTFIATVQPATASGSVAFFDGTTQIGTATMANGAAAFTTSSLAAGAHQITASYAGDATHAPSVSAARLVTVGDPLSIVTTSIAAPMLGQSYAQTIVTRGGLQPVTCSVGAGQLPQGLALNGATCAITGAPSAGVTFAFTIVATDAANATASRSYSGRIDRPDPTQDATVRGLVAAQAAQTMRFARGQSNLVQQRLERLHEDNDACASPGADVCVTFDNGISVTQAQAPRSREADAREVFDAVRSGRVVGEPMMASRRASAEKRLERALSSRFEAQDGELASSSQEPAPAASRQEAAGVYGALPGSIETRAADPSPAKPQRKGPAFTPLMLNMWASGAIQVGRYSMQQQSFGAKIDDKFRTTGLAFGVDTRLMPGLKAGLALGFGADNSEVGNDGSRTRASNVSVTLYASQKIGSSLFLDGLVGYGAMQFDTRRLQAASGDWLEGKRRGGFFFESLSLTSEHKWNGFRFAPWIGLTAIQASLDPYAENGAPEWALSYARTRLNSVDATAGLRVSYDIPMGWGVLTPLARLQYTRMFGGSMTQEMNYSVDPAMLFSVHDNAQSNWAVNGSLGFLAKGANGVSGGLEATGSTSGSGRRSSGLRGNVRVAF